MGYYKRWSNVDPIYLEIDEYNDKLKELRGMYEETFPSDVSNKRHEGKFSVHREATGLQIRLLEDGFHTKYRYINGFQRKDSPEAQIDGITGRDCYDKIAEMFENQYATTIFKAHTAKKYESEYRDIKSILPTQINYIERAIIGNFVDEVYKADVSSAFPTAACKALPTLHGHKRVLGRVSASAEYPFAFYIKSRHIEIYNELNTIEFNCEFYKDYYIGRDNIKPEDDVTILCKASEYPLDDIYKELYNNRKTSTEYKMFMVASIGYFHKNSDPNLAHIAAVVIARCNVDMIRRAKQLEEEGNSVLFIATDSIVWTGKPSSLATTEKYLGSFTYECQNGEFFAQGLKAYQVLDENGVVTTKCGHVKGAEVRAAIPFGQIPPVKDSMLKYYEITNENYIKEIDYL